MLPSSSKRNTFSKVVDGRVVSSATLSVDEPADVLLDEQQRQQSKTAIVSNISTSTEDIAAIKARARKTRTICKNARPGALSVVSAAHIDGSTNYPDEVTYNNSGDDLSHCSPGQLVANQNQSVSSLSSTTGAMKARARQQSRTHRAPITPGAISVQTHADNHHIAGSLGNSAEEGSPSSYRQKTSKEVSPSTGAMQARARQSCTVGGAPLTPGAISIVGINNNNPTRTKQQQEGNNNLSHAPGEAPPNHQSSRSTLSAVDNRAPKLPEATLKEQSFQGNIKGEKIVSTSNWMDPLAESSGRRTSFDDRSSTNHSTNHSSTDAYSQFAADPDYERRVDPAALEQDTATSAHGGGGSDGTTNAPVEQFPMWQSERILTTTVTFDRRLCIIGAAVFLAIIIGVSVSVGLTVNNGNDDSAEMKNDPLTTPTTAPAPISPAPTLIASNCAGGNGLTTKRFLQITAILGYSEPGTAPREAMCWLADLDELQLDPLQGVRLQQRYALATFYFSTTSQTAQLGLRNTNWLNAQSECTWLGLECQNDIVLSLNLSRQFLTGALPPELSLLTQLLSLRLDENALSGQIPDELFELTTLVQWGMEANQLNGTLSSRIAQLTQLEFVSFSRNQLSGTLPLELFDLKNLAGIFLAINRFSGLVPSNIGGMPQLSFFLVSDNLLTGTIPTELGLCNGLQNIAMSGNPLNSTIPTEIGLLTKLAGLNIADAGIRGSIPSEMGNCRDLNVASLQSNRELVGGIPSELGKLTSLDLMKLELTGLTGSMPTEVCLLTNGNLTSLSSDCVRDIDCPCCDQCF